MKKTCTFFGHRDCPASVMPKLRTVLVDLIEHHGVELFYVGRQGNFDTMVRAVLRELAKTHPQIRYAVVLEQLPKLRGDARVFPMQFSRRVWRMCRPVLPSPGATSGCSGVPIWW